LKHLSEEELIEHYYEEDARGTDAERHLKACAACSGSYAELRRVLDGVKPLTPPARGDDYGRQVWESIRGTLPVYETPGRVWSFTRFWKPLSLIAACALLIAGAFIAGRQWQRKQTPTVAVTADPQARQRVVVVVLGDHLDRSERLLVELNHADARDAADTASLRSEARDLLATNRLVRQSAKQAGDTELDASLDRLERLLIELANQPGGMTEADLNHLRQEMNTDGLLFDIRVLRSRVIGQQGVTETKGVAT
jgi:hypothetical protein